MIARLLFALRRRTLRRVSPDGPGRVLVFHEGAVRALPRRCPHQGADLKDGRVEAGALLCPWHGCRFQLSGGSHAGPV